MKTTICAMAKNEDRWIGEWVAHHLDLGFDEIFIYDNNSAVPITADGPVRIIPWKDDRQGKQLRAYNHFAANFQSDWTLFIDIDEFLCLKKHRVVSELLENFTDFQNLLLARLNYGCGKVEHIDSVKELHLHAHFDNPINMNPKAFVQKGLLLKSVHAGADGSRATTMRTIGREPLTYHPGLFQVAFVKHYPVRGLDSIAEKCRRGPGQNSYEAKYETYPRCMSLWHFQNLRFSEMDER